MPVRSAIVVLVGLTVSLALILLLKADVSSIIDNFHAQRSERLVLKTWMRQAVKVSYKDCLKRPEICTGKIVVWLVGNNSPAPIQWLNPDQLPKTVWRSEQYEAVGIVKRVLPGRIEMIFLGSPQAAYGGTTTKNNFGLSPQVDGTSATVTVPIVTEQGPGYQ